MAGIEFKFQNGDYFVTYKNSQKKSELRLIEHLKRVQDNGAGEIILFNVDLDGTMKGPPIKDLEKWLVSAKLPIIYSGGIGNFKHILDIFQKTQVNAVACGSLFNFGDNTPIRARSYLKNNSIIVRNAR